jgi:hypothetical protein
MKKGLRGRNVGLSSQPAPGGPCMLYAGLDLSRQRLDVHVLDEEGRTVEVTAATPEVFGRRHHTHGRDQDLRRDHRPAGPSVAPIPVRGGVRLDRGRADPRPGHPRDRRRAGSTPVSGRSPGRWPPGPPEAREARAPPQRPGSVRPGCRRPAEAARRPPARRAARRCSGWRRRPCPRLPAGRAPGHSG